MNLNKKDYMKAMIGQEVVVTNPPPNWLGEVVEAVDQETLLIKKKANGSLEKVNIFYVRSKGYRV